MTRVPQQLSALALSFLLSASACVVSDEEVDERPYPLEPTCDEDGDGYANTLCRGNDCDDRDPNVYPGHGCTEDGNCLPKICDVPVDRPDASVGE